MIIIRLRCLVGALTKKGRDGPTRKTSREHTDTIFTGMRARPCTERRVVWRPLWHLVRALERAPMFGGTSDEGSGRCDNIAAPGALTLGGCSDFGELSTAKLLPLLGALKYSRRVDGRSDVL